MRTTVLARIVILAVSLAVAGCSATPTSEGRVFASGVPPITDLDDPAILYRDIRLRGLYVVTQEFEAELRDPAFLAETREALSERLPPDVRAGLATPDAVEILTLYPHDLEAIEPGDARADFLGLPRFHGWAILGQTDVVSREDRTDVGYWLLEAVLESDGVVAECFEPRHGFRITKNGSSFDVVVCFTCLQMVIHREGKEPEWVAISQDPAVALTFFFLDKGLEFDDDFDPYEQYGEEQYEDRDDDDE